MGAEFFASEALELGLRRIKWLAIGILLLPLSSPSYAQSGGGAGGGGSGGASTGGGAATGALGSGPGSSMDLPPQIQVPPLLPTKCSRIPQLPEPRKG
jgi:hypothetical protein